MTRGQNWPGSSTNPTIANANSNIRVVQHPGQREVHTNSCVHHAHKQGRRRSPPARHRTHAMHAACCCPQAAQARQQPHAARQQPHAARRQRSAASSTTLSRARRCACRSTAEPREPAQEGPPGVAAAAAAVKGSSTGLAAPPPPAAAAAAMPTPPRLLQTDPVKLVELLSHLSQLGVRPHAGWLQDVLDVLAPSLPALSAAHLASMLQVLGSWGFTPRAPFLQQLHGAVRRRLADRELSLRNMADMTWALAQLNSPCKPLLDDLLAGAHTALGAAGAGNRSVPAAALQPASSSSSSSSSHKGAAASSSSGGGSAQPRTHPQQQVQDAHGGVCPGALADLLWSVAKLQCDVSPRWLALFAARSRALLPAFTPHQLAQLVWALARLPFHPGQPYLDDLLAAVSASLPAFEAKAISLTAWGLATLKATPGRRWLFAFERQAERTLSSLACAELACTLWALGELKAKRPHELRLGRLVRRQEGFQNFDFEALANPRLLRVVRQLTLGPPHRRGAEGTGSA